MKNLNKCGIITHVKENRKKIICIVGATASGKTSLGVFLAKKINGEIVSADSRQIYKGLDVGTGKEGELAQGAGISKLQCLITNENQNTKSQTRNFKKFSNLTMKQLSNYLRFIDDIPQWLIDICEPEVEFNMFDWLELAKKVLDNIWSRNKIPIVVGGTGLYVQALVEGFAIDRTEEQKNRRTKKQYSREELESFDLKQLQSIVSQMTKEDSRLDINNPRRLVRFIERIQAGEEPMKNKPNFDFILIGQNLPREKLYEKIDKRVEEWFNEGFYEEVEGLLDGGVSVEWLNKIGLEYKILANYIKYQKLKIKNDNLEIEKLIENCKLKIENFASLDLIKQAMKYAIHQYARRQLTWWRRFEVRWSDNPEAITETCRNFLCQ